MYYFYVLKSVNCEYLYYGSTRDLKARLEKQNSREVFSTKSKAPYQVVYYEAYLTLKLAKSREYTVKHNWAAKEELKKRIVG